MSNDDKTGAAEHTFGSCCTELNEAIQAEDFEPLITLGPDGILYMSVGLIELEDEEEPGIVDHPVFFCPFCGTKVQSREDVQAMHNADIAAH
ncbi:MAG: hypothetical protein AAFO75_04675 [Pseudomonadota bacterium]